MSGTHTGTKRAAEPDPPSPSSPSPSESHITHGGGGGGGGSGGGGGGLHGITAAQKAFHFLDGPADVLNASTACRRWRKLACAGSVWRAKAEREGILDKAEAFEVEVPAAAEGGSLEDEGAASMAFYARVFMLKVRGGLHDGGREGGPVLLSASPPLKVRGELHDGGREGGPVLVSVSPLLAPTPPPLPPCRGTR